MNFWLVVSISQANRMHLKASASIHLQYWHSRWIPSRRGRNVKSSNEFTLQYGWRGKQCLWTAFSNMVLFILQNNTLKAHWQNVSLLPEEPVFLYCMPIIFVYLGWLSKTTQQITVRKGQKRGHTAENRVSSSKNGLSKPSLPAWVFS